MNKLDQVLLKQKNGFLATIEDNKPRIRPFEIQIFLDSPFKYYLCTANTKEVYRQLQKSPFIEFSLATTDNIILRIKGTIRFDSDLAIKQKIVDTNELVRSIYKTGDNPTFEIFYIEEGEGSITYLDNRTPEYSVINNK
ncbi:pyridoxamine 5'-phosphate oxidase [Priestia megaterium]|uniref:Pyridoxamine 5'-phosphate oxidase n=2 Tax=Priestia megaterium TaxID=1404 RepID=A0A3D8WWS9_PRIMG|nr:pyridoxamine 5'-phosphate oxidase [Priestia megaterium]MBD8847311.1 pyridoxamine 5'-phosphate oxidase [Priestia megaterium]MDH3169465.1 hypothetical protein [Priestia megaterium]RDZ10114.1 pyridoxamine 5'-phosphate oxidase [Priestia megaterium]